MAFNFISQGFTKIQPTNTEPKFTAFPLILFFFFFFSPPSNSFLFYFFEFFYCYLLRREFLLWLEEFFCREETDVLFSLARFRVITFYALLTNLFALSLVQFLYPPTQPPRARERSSEGFKQLLSRAAQAARRTASCN
ncbi:hypothetical protein L873DRAFT_1353738 [Choiromyces venosus 120613-1]|uniref:Uncharacterized protein n=1 Tax=Choiromyces venosus 120613-1 TaxID=1336337 RepID=A0A3N4K5D6_9PEZI|nr:hypothetical protein L873DRAFT_1353738 [Choiromyces venosus 120613-1]